ncbi:MAG TPA: YchJ family protein [Opitutaceae bacterium]
MNACPCGSGRSYETCCEPLIAGTPATTAEALMRSRYTAYVKHAFDYLRDSLSAQQQKDFSAADTKRWAEQSEWLGLKILRTENGGPNDQTGLVEFSARYRAGGEEHEHVETALFGREGGRWVYTGQKPAPSATVRYEKPLPGRNDPCPCGSGKKYKKCCGAGK